MRLSIFYYNTSKLYKSLNFLYIYFSTCSKKFIFYFIANMSYSSNLMNLLLPQPIRFIRSYNTSYYKKTKLDLQLCQNGTVELSRFSEKVLITKIKNIYIEIRYNPYLY